MKKRIQESALIKENWFNDWFDTGFYRRLYAHRDEKEAANFIDELVSELQPKPFANILDLGCGNGRHAKRLGAKGFNVIGIDLAHSSIQDAKRWETEALHFYRHDMRHPFGKDYFDYVFNFFTSFGYFTDRENQQVISNISDSLRMGGKVVVDYMNASFAEKCLIAEDEKEIDGIVYHLTRWADEKHICKKIVIDNVQKGEPFNYTEKVAKLTVEDFETMFKNSGLQLENVYGDYELNDYNAETSPRLILIAEKS
jgi:SAM-dependent methyltransferase